MLPWLYKYQSEVPSGHVSQTLSVTYSVPSNVKREVPGVLNPVNAVGVFGLFVLGPSQLGAITGCYRLGQLDASTHTRRKSQLYDFLSARQPYK